MVSSALQTPPHHKTGRSTKRASEHSDYYDIIGRPSRQTVLCRPECSPDRDRADETHDHGAKPPSQERPEQSDHHTGGQAASKVRRNEREQRHAISGKGTTTAGRIDPERNDRIDGTKDEPEAGTPSDIISDCCSRGQ